MKSFHSLSIVSFIFPFMVLLIISGCDRAPKMQAFEGFAQGTTYHIRFWSEEDKNVEALQTAVKDEFAAIDAAMSSYRDDSVIERFNEHATDAPYSVGPEIIGLIKSAQSVSAASHGCYDLTIKPLFDLWGFKADVFSPPSAQQISEAMMNVSMSKLSIVDDQHLQKNAAGVKVDLASIGQGYSVAKIAAILETYGIQNYMVEIGGELTTQGQKPNDEPWRIAIEKPLPNEQSIHKIITIKNPARLAVMTSGTYRHYFDDQGVRYSHILDARTGSPVSHTTVSVTVLYNDAAMADAWSTALLCLGREAGLKVANELDIPALFIEQALPDQALVETYSNPWSQLSGIDVE